MTGKKARQRLIDSLRRHDIEELLDMVLELSEARQETFLRLFELIEKPTYTRQDAKEARILYSRLRSGPIRLVDAEAKVTLDPGAITAYRRFGAYVTAVFGMCKATGQTPPDTVWAVKYAIRAWNSESPSHSRSL